MNAERMGEDWLFKLQTEVSARLQGKTLPAHFRTQGAGGVAVWCKLCLCPGSCGCGVEVEAAILSRRMGARFLPHLERRVQWTTAGTPVRATCIREYSTRPSAALEVVEADRLGEALAWLHMVPPSEIFGFAVPPTYVVCHGDIFVGNLATSDEGLLLVDFADSRPGFRSEDILAALTLEFSGTEAINSFLRSYLRESGATLHNLDIDLGLQREHDRRVVRRYQRGTMAPGYEEYLRFELARARSILLGAFEA